MLDDPSQNKEATSTTEPEPQGPAFGMDWPYRQAAVVGAVLSGFLLVIVIGAIWLRRLRRRRQREVSAPPLDDIRVAELASHGPPAVGPRLECYGTRIRIAVVILAPVGRNGRIPPPEQLAGLWESLVPGLGSVLDAQQPRLQVWPPQLSSQGFTQLFCHRLALPGDRGRGTPWCSVAGKFDWSGQQFLVGLVGCGSAPNGLGQIVVQHQGLWLDVLRVRE